MTVAIPVNARTHLSPFTRDDCQGCVTYLNDREIYDRTLGLAYPYAEADFDRWMERVERTIEQFGRPLHFAIRNARGELIGACGLDHLERGHRAEIGYWLARPFWGRGIMTDVVRSLAQWGVDEWDLVRIWASVFASNKASARVLEKSGFQFEGLLHKNVLKDGRFLDSRLYARVR